MSIVHQRSVKNRLLANLSHSDFALLEPSLVKTEMVRGSLISEANEPLPYILFPESGIVSIVIQSPESQNVEGGLVGHEGFVLPAILLGTDRVPHRVEVQIAGYGYKIGTSEFIALVNKSPNLRTKMLRFAHCLSVQTSFTATSNALHTIDERLARWLLMCHDRLDSDDLPLTHKFMSVMLAVRRASVTVALQNLESYGFIQTDRAFVLLLKRNALMDFAGDAYGRPEAEYERLLGPSAKTL